MHDRERRTFSDREIESVVCVFYGVDVVFHLLWSLSRGRALLKATPSKAPPIVEDSPTRNRPPMPLPEETRREEEDDDDEYVYVYERVNTTD